MTAGLQFTRPQLQAVAELQLAGDLCQPTFAHEVRTHPREHPFVKFREAFVKQFRDDQTDDRVTEKFEALVVGPTGTAVDQRQIAEGTDHSSIRTEASAQLDRTLEFRDIV